MEGAQDVIEARGPSPGTRTGCQAFLVSTVPRAGIWHSSSTGASLLQVVIQKWQAASSRTYERPLSQLGSCQAFVQLPIILRQGVPGPGFLLAATLVGSAVALDTSSLLGSWGGFWWFAGALQQGQCSSKEIPAPVRLLQKPKAGALELQFWATHAPLHKGSLRPACTPLAAVRQPSMWAVETGCW